MHLQTLPSAAGRHKVWLEEGGRRVFEPDGKIPAKVRNALHEKLTSDEGLAWNVRARWVRMMIEKQWLKLELRSDTARLVAYPGTPHAFVREIDLRKHASPSRYATAADVKHHAETAALVLDAQRGEDEWVLINLADVLWQAE